MYLVITRVPVEPGSIDELAALFDETNRNLVAGHPDWLGADFTADRAASVVTVVARWRDRDAYEQLRSSPEFQETMATFARRFTAPPQITVSEILVTM